MAETSPRDYLDRRLTRVRAGFAPAGIDALIVTHLPNIRYLTGFAATAGSLVVTSDRAFLVVDFRYATSAQRLAAECSGLFEVIVAERNPEQALIALVKRLAPGQLGIESDVMTVSAFNRLMGESLTVVPTRRVVEVARMVKDALELRTLREAARRLSTVAREARTFLVAGRTEREVAANLDHAVRQAGFERAAFETIVASGPNSALPHARPTSRTLLDGEGVVLDFGGVYDGYCVDLTRTVHLGAREGPIRRIFAAVAEAHAAAVAAVRPGVAATVVDAAARDVLARHGLAEAFGHGTGHGLGLEVHEEPRISKAGTVDPDTVLEPGMVFTIEPGAYVPDVGGVRIEDDVLVTRDGAELLTDVPIDL